MIKLIIAVVGPTGVGKTKISELLAQKYQAIVINADAIQIYKELNIGSAKPKKEEKSCLEHYLFDIKSITEEYNVIDYQKDLRNIIKLNEDRNIIIVGGTGLYLMAGLYDYEFKRETNNINYENFSNEELYELALKKDSNMQIHINNRLRLIRFLKKENSSQNGNKLLYDVKFIGLTTKRDILYEKINQRVDHMIEEDLIDEVKSLYLYKNKSRVLNSAIGYKEIIQQLEGLISLEEAINRIKKNSRRYAKRQYTWFNNKMNINWFEVNFEDLNITLNEIISYLDAIKK